jgi:hypothetical protein
LRKCFNEADFRLSLIAKPDRCTIVTIPEQETYPLDTASIIAELTAERDRIEQALAALRGRQTKSVTVSGKPDGRRRKRKLSAAARNRIGEAMKKRWAERKKKQA